MYIDIYVSMDSECLTMKMFFFLFLSLFLSLSLSLSLFCPLSRTLSRTLSLSGGHGNPATAATVAGNATIEGGYQHLCRPLAHELRCLSVMSHMSMSHGAYVIESCLTHE